MFDELKNSLIKNQKVEKEKEEIFLKKKTLEREISQLKDEKSLMQEKISSLKKSELEFSYFQSSKTLNSLILNKEMYHKKHNKEQFPPRVQRQARRKGNKSRASKQHSQNGQQLFHAKIQNNGKRAPKHQKPKNAL